MSSSLVLLPMVLASSGIYLFTTKTFWPLILSFGQQGMPFSFTLQSGFSNPDLELRGMYAFAKCLSSPKVKYVRNASTGKYHRHCFCVNPCTASGCGRMIYVYPEKDLRAYL